MNVRKIVTITTVAGLFFWAPSVIPARAALAPCGVGIVWLPSDTAFAIPLSTPCPTSTAGTPWAVLAIGLSAASVIINSIIVSRTQCRELTQQEAFSSISLPFIGIAMNQKINKCHR